MALAASDGQIVISRNHRCAAFRLDASHQFHRRVARHRHACVTFRLLLADYSFKLAFISFNEPRVCNGSKASLRGFSRLLSGVVFRRQSDCGRSRIARSGARGRAIVSRPRVHGERLPTLTPDDKAMIHAKHGPRACSLTLVRRASVLSGWKISAQDCKPKTSKGAKRG